MMVMMMVVVMVIVVIKGSSIKGHPDPSSSHSDRYNDLDQTYHSSADYHLQEIIHHGQCPATSLTIQVGGGIRNEVVISRARYRPATRHS
jgi:hypothetical protein